MPSVSLHGTTKRFPYTPKGIAAAKAAAKKGGGILHITKAGPSRMTMKNYLGKTKDRRIAKAQPKQSGTKANT